MVDQKIEEVYTVTRGTWDRAVYFSNLQNCVQHFTSPGAEILVLNSLSNDLCQYSQVVPETTKRLAKEFYDFAQGLGFKLTIINAVIPCRTGNLRSATPEVYWQNAENTNAEIEKLCSTAEAKTANIFFNPMQGFRYKQDPVTFQRVPVTADDVLEDRIHPKLCADDNYPLGGKFWQRTRQFVLDHLCLLEGGVFRKRNKQKNHRNSSDISHSGRQTETATETEKKPKQHVCS